MKCMFTGYTLSCVLFRIDMGFGAFGLVPRCFPISCWERRGGASGARVWNVRSRSGGPSAWLSVAKDSLSVLSVASI